MPNRLRFLKTETVKQIIEHAVYLLKNHGMTIHNEEAVSLLSGFGGRVDNKTSRIWFNEAMIETALKSVPEQFFLFDRPATTDYRLGDGTPHFVPGSSAIDILDAENLQHRKPQTTDYIRYVLVAGQLPAISAQSTAFIPADVADEISDSYRLFLSLLFGEKAVVTGAFSAASFDVMRDFQLIIRGSADELRAKPLTVFSCCPSSPLKWSRDTSQNIIDCARSSIPIELVAMPLSGFLAPVTLFDTIIQHTAENLSGIVISQCANPGAPLLYGGSPAIFDMRFQTTPMGAVETMMMICAYNEIGKTLGLPTQAYIALSDAKLVDMQAGYETGMGAVLSALSGIDSISGPGMIDFESSFSIEKLIIDNEICLMTQRLLQGISEPGEEFFPSVFEELIRDQHLLASEHTQLFLRREHMIPGDTVCRKNREAWIAEGESTILQRAKEAVKGMLQNPPEHTLDPYIAKSLVQRMLSEALKYGMEKLPLHNLKNVRL